MLTTTAIFTFVTTVLLSSPGSAAPSQSFEHDDQETSHSSLILRDGDIIVNSGLCETTPGITQRSGYFTIGENMNMWFWFFGARKSPSTAPLIIWLNGGPGASSMMGLFQQNGPCHFIPGSNQPILNPYSFNEEANMLYIDQPVGVGFSYADDPTSEEQVNSTDTAVQYVYDFLQEFYTEFDEFIGRPTGIFTASYGGHYGPVLARYIQEQNKACRITTTTTTTNKAAHKHHPPPKVPINLLGLAINDGLFDYAIQQPAMADYLLLQGNITTQLHNDTMSAFETRCAPALRICRETNTASDCSAADDACYNSVEGPMSDVIGYVYDIRGREGYAPPEEYVTWLINGTVQGEDGGEVKVVDRIGARKMFLKSNDDVFQRFIGTGDTARTTVPALSELAQSGLPILLWAGDKDFLCNFVGVRRVSETVMFAGQSDFAGSDLTEWKINGTVYGTFKTQGNLAYLQVKDAGHYLMFNQPAASLEVLRQFINTGSIKSV